MTTKLTDDQVRAIRERAAGGELHRVLAAEFGRSMTGISHIVAGRSYPHVGGTLKPPRRAAPPGFHHCPRCNKDRPESDFTMRGRKRKDGTRGFAGYCTDCTKRLAARNYAERRGGPPGWRKRKNAHGDYWCPNCAHYLPATSYTFPAHEGGKPATYCKSCTRELNKFTYRQIKATPERIDAHKKRSRANKRRKTLAERAERADFVRRGLALLRSRGFTPGDIDAVLGVTPSARYRWQKRGRPGVHAAERMRVVLQATIGWPVTPPRRHRQPRPPQIVQLIAETRDDVLAFSLRNRWKEDAMLAAD